MTSGLPDWVQYLQALSTPAIALLAAVIGIMQWRTSHQRAVLDLFDKRWETYRSLGQHIAEVLQHGSVSEKTYIDYLRTKDRAEHLFGPEVTKYLDEVKDLFTRHQDAEQQMKLEGPDHAKWVDRKYRAFEAISKSHGRLKPLVAPYMRMHQKAPWF